MHQRHPKGIRLHRETLRQLETGSLRQVAAMSVHTQLCCDITAAISCILGCTGIVGRPSQQHHGCTP